MKRKCINEESLVLPVVLLVQVRLSIARQQVFTLSSEFISFGSTTSGYTPVLFSILSAAPSFTSAVEGGEVVTSQETCAAPTTRQPQRMRQNRYTLFRVLIGSNPFSLICEKFCEEFGPLIV